MISRVRRLWGRHRPGTLAGRLALGGIGLGLALTRRICRAAGGDVTAAVRDGRTIFTLTFPCL